MAIHGPSIPAPNAHPRFVRGGNAPARILTEADVIALTAETVLTLHALTAETLDMLEAIPSAPLPSLQTAFARRRAIFGPHTGDFPGEPSVAERQSDMGGCVNG